MVRHKKLSIGFLNSCKKYEFNNENLKNNLYRKINIIQKDTKKSKKIEEKKKKRKIFLFQKKKTLYFGVILFINMDIVNMN